MRLPLSVLQGIYPPPTYQFEISFAENDPLWKRDERETDDHVQERAKHVLDVIFGEPETCESIRSTHYLYSSTCVDVSITAHGWFIRGLLAETKHQPYRIPIGGRFTHFCDVGILPICSLGILPVVIKQVAN